MKINKSGNHNNDYFVKEKRNIKIRNLDQILKNKNLIKPLLIKIDVQGFELEVLKGAKQILSKVDYILLEVSKSRMYNKQPIEREILDFLKKNKFKPLKALKWLKIENTNFMQRDILFERKITNGGFVGCINKNFDPINPHTIKKIIQEHRGPDDNGLALFSLNNKTSISYDKNDIKNLNTN